MFGRLLDCYTIYVYLFSGAGRSSCWASAHILHCVSKNVPALVRYNFDTRERIFIFFGRNITHKVSNQKHFTMPPQVKCASALPGKTGKHENRIFSLKRCISPLREFNQSILDICRLFWLTTHPHAAVWLTRSCSQCSQLGLLAARFKKRTSREAQQFDCVARTMHVHQCAVFMKENKYKKASIRWQDSAPPISGYWPTSDQVIIWMCFVFLGKATYSI